MTTDTAAAPVKRTRKSVSFAEKKAQLRQQLADLMAKEAKKELAEKIKNGEVADPATAKMCTTEMRYLAGARATFIKYGACDAAKCDEIMAALQAALTTAVG